MFPIVTGVADDDHYRNLERARRRETKPDGRLDAQRQLLECKKMYHLNSMSVDERARDRERDLVQRQRIAQATLNHVTLSSQVRRSLGGALIAIGQRIQPQFAQGKPTFNG
ncbi:MAG: hypothetical protein WKF63_05045 [Thermomicrobiales bacterium]